ncbi:hypothetical protein ACH5RR_024937 [Cinchona calisaya]|uniref:Uncharacterized protein n=1 Tax=Cinchona calisaya TaxID=153742 RepID=A0ABD2Z1K6_9GENT
MSFYARSLHLLPFLSTSRSNPIHISPSQSTFSSLNFRRLFSSEVSNSKDSNLDQSHNDDDAEKLSNKELKRQIEKFYDGDEDAFASLFEAILRRKLSGKSDEMDEVLIKELPDWPQILEDDDDDEESDDKDDDEESDDKEFDSD